MNKVVVITGVSSGIGKSTYDRLKALGHIVVGVGRNKDSADYVADVANLDAVKKAFDDIGNKYGRIDVLINNAGYGLNGVMELIPMDKIKEQFDVNVFGVIRCIKCALPYMQAGSRIINIASAMTILPMPYRSMYASSKSAVVTLSYSLRNELKGAGIDVVVVNPANIKTNFTKNKQVVTDTNSRYGDRPALAQARFDSEKMENKRLPVDKVSSALVCITSKKHTKPMYIVGFNMKLGYLATKLLPLKLVLAVVGKFCN